MNKWIKILIGIVATPVLLAGILLLIYVLWNIQGVIEPFQRGNPDAKYQILIASQGSEYKESLDEIPGRHARPQQDNAGLHLRRW